MDLLSMNETEPEEKSTEVPYARSPAVDVTMTSDEVRETKGLLSAAYLAEPKEKCLMFENPVIKIFIASEYRAFKVSFICFKMTMCTKCVYQ